MATWTIEQAQAYIAGMIDGEGWIGEYKQTVFNRAIRISNTNPELIDAIKECLDLLSVHYTVTAEDRKKPNWSPQQRVEITGYANLKYIADHVPFRASKKRGRLERLVASYKKVPPIDEAELRRLYLDEKMTDLQVARAMGVGKKRIILARNRYGIPGHSPKDRAPMIWEARYKRFGKAGRPTK